MMRWTAQIEKREGVRGETLNVDKKGTENLLIPVTWGHHFLATISRWLP